MSRTKKSLILMAVLILAASAVFAKKCKDDFNQEEFDSLLKGEKNLVGAKLEEANLQGMDLTGRDFSGADLEKANLQNANLTNAIFKNADLEKANLKGAKITGAIFKGAELEFATWVDGRLCAEDSLGGCW
jgi:uncharacterized protein YjbI with pentapeptide repeats